MYDNSSVDGFASSKIRTRQPIQNHNGFGRVRLDFTRTVQKKKGWTGLDRFGFIGDPNS